MYGIVPYMYHTKNNQMQVNIIYMGTMGNNVPPNPNMYIYIYSGILFLLLTCYFHYYPAHVLPHVVLLYVFVAFVYIIIYYINYILYIVIRRYTLYMFQHGDR